MPASLCIWLGNVLVGFRTLESRGRHEHKVGFVDVNICLQIRMIFDAFRFGGSSSRRSLERVPDFPQPRWFYHVEVY